MKRVIRSSLNSYILTDSDKEYIDKNVSDLAYQVYRDSGPRFASDIIFDHMIDVIFDPQYASDHEVSPQLVSAVQNNVSSVIEYIQDCIDTYCEQYM